MTDDPALFAIVPLPPPGGHYLWRASRRLRAAIFFFGGLPNLGRAGTGRSGMGTPQTAH